MPLNKSFIELDRKYFTFNMLTSFIRLLHRCRNTELKIITLQLSKNASIIQLVITCLTIYITFLTYDLFIYPMNKES